MIEIAYHKEVACPISKADVSLITAIAAKHEKKIKGLVEVTIVSDATIKKLNHQYRGKNKVTDVLSFGWEEGGKMPSTILGEIYICYDQIKRQAKTFECPVKEEFTRMLVHGLLHIVGYDHVTKAQAGKMFPLQEKIVSKACDLL